MAILQSKEPRLPDSPMSYASQTRSSAQLTKPFYAQSKNYLLLMLVITFEILLGGLYVMKTNLAQSWGQLSSDFRWMVLVNGTPVENDEVGAHLKKLNGAENVKFISPDEIFNDLKNRGLAEEVQSSHLPSSWEVQWNVEQFEPAAMDESLVDIKRTPGVIDVAFNQNLLNQILTERYRWFQTRLILSICVLFAVIFGSFVLGKFSFSSPGQHGSWGQFIGSVAFFATGWALGCGIIWVTLGPIPLGFWFVGLIPGAFRYFWIHS